MTGLIYNRPDEPLRFLETAIAQIRANPEDELTWDMFIDKGKLNTLGKLSVHLVQYVLKSSYKRRRPDLFHKRRNEASGIEAICDARKT